METYTFLNNLLDILPMRVVVGIVPLCSFLGSYLLRDECIFLEDDSRGFIVLVFQEKNRDREFSVEGNFWSSLDLSVDNFHESFQSLKQMH